MQPWHITFCQSALVTVSFIVAYYTAFHIQLFILTNNLYKRIWDEFKRFIALSFILTIF